MHIPNPYCSVQWIPEQKNNEALTDLHIRLLSHHKIQDWPLLEEPLLAKLIVNRMLVGGLKSTSRAPDCYIN